MARSKKFSARRKPWNKQLCIEVLEGRVVPSVTLLTDKPDYAPGETALLSGSGFALAETVDLRVVRTDGFQDYPGGNLPWQVTDGGAGDLDGVADGKFRTSWFVEDQYAGASLLAIGSGLTSGETVQWAFTDGATSATLTSPTAANPAPVGGFPATVHVTFLYSTSSDDGTTSGLVEVKTAGGAVVASSSRPLPSAKLTKSDFIDVTIPAGTANGSYSVKLTISHTNPGSNQAGLKDSTQVNALIIAANPPVLQFIPPQTVNELTPRTFQVVATDPNLPNDTLTFSLANQPAGAAINSATGAFSWTPAENQDGVYLFDVVVRDSWGNTASQTVQFTVNEVNRGPTLISPAPTTVVKTTALTFTAVASDPDTVNPGAIPNTLTFSLVGAPSGATINSATGAFSWTPDMDTDGTFTFKVRVTDNGSPNLFAEQTLSITAVAAGIVGGDLYVVGHHNADDTLATATNGSTEVRVNGVLAGIFSGFQRIVYRAGNGNDTVSIQGWKGPAVVEGGAGSDTVAASQNANFALGASLLSSSDGLSAALDSVEKVSLIGSGATPVSVSGWTGTTLTVSGAGPVVLGSVNAASGGIAVAASTIQVNGPVITTASGPLTLNGAITVAQGGSITADGDLSFSYITATGNLPLISTTGNITIGVINAGGFTVTLNAGAAILDGNGAQNNVTAHTLVMTTGAGIASASDPLETVVHFVNAQGGTGGIFVDNHGDMTVTGASALGAIDFQVHSNLVIGGQITSGAGNVTLAAGDGGDITLAAAVSGADVTLDAGGTLTVPLNTISAAGDLTMSAAFVDADLTGATLGDASFSSGIGGSSLSIAQASFRTAKFSGAGFDIDAVGASFDAAFFSGNNFDLDATDAIFAAFDVDADGFDLDATDATFGTVLFRGKNFDIDATDASFTGQVLFDSEAEGFDFEAEGFDIDATDATFSHVFFVGKAFDVDATDAVFTSFDVEAEGFDIDATAATFGTGFFRGKNFDIDATDASFTGQVLFDSEAEGFDFEAEGFDIDATDATFSHVFFVGKAFDVDATDAVFTSFDVEAEGFDIDATDATFGTGFFRGKNFDIDATDASFTGQVLFDSEAEGFDFEAEGFDIDATDATFSHVFFVGKAFDIDATDFDGNLTGAVFTLFDVEAEGFDIDATDATFGTGFFRGKNFDIDATDASFTGQVLFDSEAEGFDFEAEGFDIDATDATFGRVFFVGKAFDVDATDAVFTSFDVEAEGFDIDATDATFGTGFFRGKNFDIDATDANFTGQILFDSEAEGFDFEAEGFDIDATDATFGRVFFVGKAFDIDADGAHFDLAQFSGSYFDVDASDANFDAAQFLGSNFVIDLSNTDFGFSDFGGTSFVVNLDQAEFHQIQTQGSGFVVSMPRSKFDQAFFLASGSSISAIGATFDDIFNFASGAGTTMDVSGATFSSLTNQAQNVTLIKADGATFGRLVNEANNVSNIRAVGATFEVIRNHGNFVSGITASGSSRPSSLINYGNNVTGIDFSGGASTDVFVNTGNSVSAYFRGLGGNDSAYVGGTGVSATLDGGAGSDWYSFSGAVSAQVSVVESYTGVADASADTLDFSSFTGAAVTLNLGSTSLQTFGALGLTFSDARGIENVVGSAGADVITGNGQNNYLLGADQADDRITTVSARNGRTAVVLLDFNTYTNVVTPGVDTGTTDHVYTAAERAGIQARMESLYHGPDSNPANWWFNVVFTQSASAAASLAGGNGYATIWFNRPRVDADGAEQPGGESSEVDFRNKSLVGESVIQINGLLGGLNQAADTTENWVMASANVAAHELAHMMGVRHADAFGPIGYGIHNPPGASAYTPAYPGPAGAFESNYHLITSPASTGSTVADVVKDLFFGEREAVRLAMAFYAPQNPTAGTIVVAETASAHATTSTAQQLTLLGLNVPNTLRQGLNVNKQFSVAAVDAVGSMTSVSQVDVYSFLGRAGDLINLEVVSDGVVRTGQTTNGINAIMEIVDSSGNTIAYYNPDRALTDDEFESFDAQIIDLRLPGDGTYFVQVTTKAVDSDGNPLTITAATPGVYELFLYRFKTFNAADGGDVLSGMAGNDTIIGGLGNDTINGGLGVDLMNGGAGTDTVIGADTTNLWTFSGADAGTINQSSFARFEQLQGGAQNDTFAIANGTTITASIDGGGGSNTLDYSAWTTGVSVNLATGAATALPGGVLGRKLQNVTGGSANDTLTGDGLANVFTGNAGSDTMVGGLGNDTFVFTDTSDDETDTATGGGGRDTLDFSQHTLGITIHLNGGGNAQQIGSGAKLKLTADDVEGIIGTSQADKLTGNVLDNFLIGGGGNDDLSGSAGNDVIIGGAGDDTLVGGDGNDVLVGGAGADNLTGSAGKDVLFAGDLVGFYDYSAADAGFLGLAQFSGQAWSNNYDLLRALGDGWALNNIAVADIAGDSNANSEDIIDQEYDVLTGNGANDWFIVQSGFDKITDSASGDKITNTN